MSSWPGCTTEEDPVCLTPYKGGRGLILSLEMAGVRTGSGVCDEYRFGWERTTLVKKRGRGCADSRHQIGENQQALASTEVSEASLKTSYRQRQLS